MHKHHRVLRTVAETPWAITEEKLAEINGFMDRVRAGDLGVEAAARAEFAPAEERPRVRVGSVEIIPVQGVIAQKMNLFSDISGGTSTELLAQQIQRAVDDSQVQTILLDIDSPGGSVFGVLELCDFMLQARAKKRIVALASPYAASAAYWIAASASEIVVAPSGMVGSIGVLMTHTEYTKAFEMQGIKTTIIRAGKYKVETNPYEPLNDDARAHLQAQCDEYYEMFVKGVASGRGVDPRTVRSSFGQGRMVMAAEAKTLGMADRLGTLDSTLGRLLMRGARETGGKSAAATVRDFEAFLRDEGSLSNSEAKRIASLAFKTEPPSETGAAEPAPQTGVDEQETRKALRAYVDQLQK